MQPRTALRVVRAAITLAGLATIAGAAAAHDAARTPIIRLVEVDTRVGRDDPTLAPTLRAALERELADLRFSGGVGRRSLVVSASLVVFESEASAASSLATAVVSATVRDARRGAIEAVVEGHARAANDASHLATAELGALAAAAHEAVAGIPDAVRRRR